MARTGQSLEELRHPLLHPGGMEDCTWWQGQDKRPLAHQYLIEVAQRRPFCRYRRQNHCQATRRLLVKAHRRDANRLVYASDDV
jgi:hypothetical protein